MGIIQFNLQLIRNLHYPLKTASLISILFLWIIGLVLYFLALIISRMGIAAVVIVYAYGIIALLVYLNLLVEYCMEVMDCTRKNQNDPPVMKTSTVHHLIGSMITMGRRRFIKQALMISLYLGLANELYKAGFLIPSIILGTFFFLVLPASFGMNAIYSNFPDIINPFKVSRFIYDLGRSYIPLILLFMLAIFSLWAALLAGTAGMLVLLPAGLYLFILNFRMMGCVIRDNHDIFFPKPDTHAYKQDLQTISDNNREFDLILSDAHQMIRDHQLDQAIEKIITFAQTDHWKKFDHIYNCIRDWKIKLPAITMIKGYLPVILESNNPMKAFELCHWALLNDEKFFLNNSQVIMQLGREAITAQHLNDVIKLMENFIEQSGSPEDKNLILNQAIDLAESRLKDSELFSRLSALNS